MRLTAKTAAFLLCATAAAVAGGTLLLTAAGCKPVEPPKPSAKYSELGMDPRLPKFLQGTIKSMVVPGNTGVFPVTSWGLIVNLRGSGDCTAPTIVRDYMAKEITRHQFGSSIHGTKEMTPEAVFRDKRVAIVGVVGYIPPGARHGDRIDVVCQAQPGNHTTSLASGFLYRAPLRIRGIEDPFGAVNEYAKAQGFLFVNPVYAIESSAAQQNAAAKASLRTAIIPGGGYVTTDRPIHLRLRSPSWGTSRALERRLNDAFQRTLDMPRKDGAGMGLAEAQDEGYLHLYVPRSFHGQWEHFLGVATHVYINGAPAFASLKAKELAEEAVKPDAPLLDISYCWEALGKVALPSITPLLTHPSPDVQFAAARAAAFIGDRYGEDTLARMARTTDHPFQVNAVQALGELPRSDQLDAALADLLDAPNALVRIEAYKVLQQHGDPRVFSKVVRSDSAPENEFVLDMVASSGTPLIYCSRVGPPRVAVFGHKLAISTPLTFSAFDTRLTISSMTDRPRSLSIYYVDDQLPGPLRGVSSPDVGELVARLGGASADGFRFTYGEVVAILQAMAERKNIPAAFVLQQLPDTGDDVNDAPPIPDNRGGRPQGDQKPPSVGDAR